MNIKISPEKAIEILQKRKSEIHQHDFDSNVWRGKTENDLEEIFGVLDGKKFQIGRITFETPFTQEKFAVMSKGKSQAVKFLESYIEQIEEYTSIQNEKAIEKENHFENKNIELESNLKSLSNNSNILQNEKKILEKELRIKNNQIEHLENNTVQLNNISFRKILTLISHLPSVQVIGIITSILGIIGFFFWLGTIVQDTSNNTKEFNLNKEITNQKDSIKNLNKEIKFKNIIILKERNEIDSLKNRIKK